MALNYREDKDLDFLAFAHHNDLVVLARYLTHDSAGERRVAQQLLDDPLYTRHETDLRMAWRSIAAELQAYGGDALMNFVRRSGVPYEEILDDICDRIGIKGTLAKEALAREDQLLQTLLEKYLEKASPEDTERILKSATERVGREKALTQKELLDLVGSDFKISLLVAQAVALGLQRVMAAAALTTMAKFAATRVAALATPLVNVALLPLFATYLTGPAYRVTVPAAVQIAYMRRLALADRYPEAV